MTPKYLVAELIADVARKLSDATKVKIAQGCGEVCGQRLKNIQGVADKNCIIAEANFQALDVDNNSNYRTQMR